jgi:hypothetical protein
MKMFEDRDILSPGYAPSTLLTTFRGDPCDVVDEEGNTLTFGKFIGRSDLIWAVINSDIEYNSPKSIKRIIFLNRVRVFKYFIMG